VVERYLSNPKKNRAPSNRRAKGRLWNDKGSDERLHRVEWDKRVQPERHCYAKAAIEDRELGDATEQ
jgi:hypothetical protein